MSKSNKKLPKNLINAPIPIINPNLFGNSRAEKNSIPKKKQIINDLQIPIINLNLLDLISKNKLQQTNDDKNQKHKRSFEQICEYYSNNHKINKHSINIAKQIKKKYELVQKNRKRYNDSLNSHWPIKLDYFKQIENLKNFYHETDYKFIERLICSVCGTFFLINNNKFENYEYDYRIILNNQHLLHSSNLNDFEHQEDFIYENFEELNGIVLDPDGLIPEKKKAIICEYCHMKLNKYELPKFALANNLYLGKDSDELNDLTCIEECLIARHHIKSTILRINSKYKQGQLKMKGNIITYVKNPDNILNLLPSLPNKELIQIAFVGNNYNKEKVLKLLRVRKYKIELALRKLKVINAQYKHVQISDNNLAQLPLDDIPQILMDEALIVNNKDDNKLNIGYDNIERSEIIVNDDNNDYFTLESSTIVNSIESISLNTQDQISLIANSYAKNSQTSYINEKEDKYLKNVHNNEPINEINNPLHLINAYPNLFPYGIGGICDSRRKVKLSYREHVNYLLRLNSDKFRTNYSFMFVAFNIIQRNEARQSIHLLVKQKDFNNFANNVSKLNIDDFKFAAEQLEKNPNAKINPIIAQLLKKVQSASAKVQGSKAALKNRRNDIRAYIIYFGTPHFFITINPVDIHAPLLLRIGGCEIKPELLIRNTSFRINYLKKNPYLQAIYFDIIIKNFIKFLLNYDKSNLIVQKEGIIGYVKSYYGCVETQDRGSLHIHFLIWLFGGLNPLEYKDKIRFNNFKKKLIEYLNDIIHCDFDGLIENIRSKNGEENNNIDEIHPCCKSIDYVQENLNEENKKIFLNDVYNVAKESVLHKCSFSCYKYNKNGEKEYRHNFGINNTGKALIKTTTIAKNGTIKLKRNHPHVNEFNWFLMAGLRCNHDIKFISANQNQSLSIIYYLTNYITKNGLSTYNNALYSVLAMKSIEKFKKNQTNEEEKTKNILSACHNAATNNTEYSGAFVANMLLQNGNDGTYYASHSIKILNLFCLLQKLVGKEELNDLVSIDNIFKKDEKHLNVLLYDFEYRPPELNNICLYEFTSEYLKKKKNIMKLKTTGKIKSYKFNVNHNKYKTHSLVKQRFPVVPLILSPSIPRKNNIEKKSLYNKIILTLFYPWQKFRQLQQLCNSNDESIENIIFNFPIHIKRYIDNLEFLKKAKNDAEEEKTFKTNKHKSKNTIFQQLIIDDSDEEETDFTNLINSNPELLTLIDKKNDDNWTKEAINILNKNNIDYNVINSNNNNNIKYNDNFFIEYDNKQIKKIETWEKQIIQANEDLDVDNINIFDEQYDVDPTILESVNSNNNFTNEVVSLLKNSINDTIAKFKLNTNQEKALRLFLEPLINNEAQQKLIYLGGEGGTGKSQIIHAITDFFSINLISNKLERAGPTGSASSLIDGNTIHKLACLDVYSKNRIQKENDNHSKQLMKLKKRWKDVEFLIIDEVSMISLLMLNEISENLNIAKENIIMNNNNAVYFGGINVLFAGDIFQLPPFGGYPLYLNVFSEKFDNINLTIKSKTYEKAINGRTIWKSLTNSVILTKQMRQSEDLSFNNLLSRLRTGNSNNDTINDDYKLLQSRILNEKDLNSVEWKNAKFIVSRNFIREEINKLKIYEYAQANNKIIFECIANDTLVKHESDQLISKRLKIIMNNLEENKTDNLMTNLLLVKGANYYLTKNIATKYGIVNGTEVELISICTNDFSLNTIPKYLLVKVLNNAALNKINFDGLPSDVIPIFPYESRFSVNLNSTYLKTKSVTVKRKQFPLTIGYCLTHFKAQGKTINKLIVDLSKPKGKLDFSYAYVVLTRAKKLEDIKILRDFDITILEPNLPITLVQEMHRLEELEKQF